MTDLRELAERVAEMGCDMVCPLCGDTDYDAVGLAHHIMNGCDVADAAVWVNSNAELADSLRALATTREQSNHE